MRPASRTQAAETHNSLRKRIEVAIVEVLEERPTGKARLVEKVLERVPQVGAAAIKQTQARLARERRLETRANKLQLSGVDTSQPITNLERQVVGCLAAGARSAKEVAEECDLVRNAFSARTICAALVGRGVIGQRPGSPPVYEQVQQEAVAVGG